MQLRTISSAPHVAVESLSLINVRLSAVEMAELKQQQQRRGPRELRFFIMHLICPPPPPAPPNFA